MANWQVVKPFTLAGIGQYSSIVIFPLERNVFKSG